MVANKEADVHYGEITLDSECFFAVRDGSKVHFTRNERAILLALSRHPNLLMTRNHLLDQIAADEDRSDRYIDFLVNRLRSKLRDDPKSPTFIKTRYGEGYVWAVTPTAAAPLHALLAITARFSPDDQLTDREMSTLVERLHKSIGTGLGSNKAILVGEGWQPRNGDRVGHLVHLNLRASGEIPGCVVTLREISSRRITASFRLDFKKQGYSNLAAQTDVMAQGVLTALRRSLAQATTGLG